MKNKINSLIEIYKKEIEIHKKRGEYASSKALSWAVECLKNSNKDSESVKHLSEFFRIEASVAEDKEQYVRFNILNRVARYLELMVENETA